MQAFESDQRSLKKPYKNTFQAEDLEHTAGTASKSTQNAYFLNKKINYLYDGAGTKVEKKVTDGSTLTITDYVSGGYQYRKIGSGSPDLLFFPHAEGYVSHTSSRGTSSFNYVFNYKDHLGNLRLTYTKNPTTGVLTILEENNYYPFGLKHSNYNWDKAYYDAVESGAIVIVPVAALPYKYKYNGKEFQDELGLGWYDYQARNYDPAIARWMNIDPLAEQMRRWSPYNYCFNNPMRFVDPDGMGPWEPDKNGNLVAEKGDNVETLAKFLNTTTKDVTNRFSLYSNDKSLPANYQFKEGDKVILNNNMTDSINQSQGTSAYEYIMQGEDLKMDTKNDMYMCQESVMTGSRGEEIGNANTESFSKDFKEVKSFDDLTFGKGAVYLQMANGEEHYMLPYGKSNDGTPYVYSKEGNAFKPGVYELGTKGGDKGAPTAINFQRAINNSEVKTVKYYQYVGQ